MKDGGSAFPYKTISHFVKNKNDEAVPMFEVVPGMTLRDYFAGQYAASGCDPELAYKKADAMLAEREKQG